MNEEGTLSILIDIRAQLTELNRAQNETARLTDQTRKAGEEANKLGSAFKLGIGIDLARRGIGLLTNSLRESVSQAFRLAEATKAAADNLQIDVRSYQVLSDMVKSAHGDVSALAGALNNQRASMVQARDTTSSAASALRVLGLDYSRIAAMRPERQFEAIAKAIRGATDQEAAFAAASELLGERNVRNLRKALEDLAEHGFDKVKASAEGAGKFMTAATIAQLNALKKMWGDNWDKFVAKIGNDVASFSTLFFGQAPVPETEEKSGDQLRAAANLVTQQKALVDAQQRFAESARRMEVVSGNPLLREDAKRTSALMLLNDQRAALNEVLALRGENAEWLNREIGSLEKATFQMRWQAMLGGEMTDHYHALTSRLERLRDIQRAGAMPLAIENKETDQKRAEEVSKLRAEIAKLENELNDMLGKGRMTAIEDVRTRFDKFQNPSNPTVALGRDPRLDVKEGVQAGAMEWVMSLGTQGEQVAAALQATLGQAVNSISDGIYGWITGAHSFGDAMRNLAGNALRIVLDTIVQIGTQWLVTAAIGKMVRAQESAQTKQGIAEKSGEGFMKSVAQLGPLAGPLAFAGALAAMMALVGGFRERGGPVSAGTAYVVGEKRPELFVPSVSGTILPSLDNLPVPAGARATASSAPALSAAALSAGGAAGGGGGDRYIIALAKDMNDVNQIKRQIGWNKAVVTTVKEHLGEIMGG